MSDNKLGHETVSDMQIVLFTFINTAITVIFFSYLEEMNIIKLKIIIPIRHYTFTNDFVTHFFDRQVEF